MRMDKRDTRRIIIRVQPELAEKLERLRRVLEYDTGRDRFPSASIARALLILALPIAEADLEQFAPLVRDEVRAPGPSRLVHPTAEEFLRLRLAAG